MQRLRRAADLGRNRRNRGPARNVLAFVIHNQPRRTARSSGENLFVVLLVIAPPSQELEPPINRSGSLSARKQCLRQAEAVSSKSDKQCQSTLLPFRRGIALPAASVQKRAIVSKFRVSQTKIASEYPAFWDIEKGEDGVGIQD